MALLEDGDSSPPVARCSRPRAIVLRNDTRGARRSKASPARTRVALGELDGAGRDRRERRALRDRSARRTEDRLVLRPAREPPLRRALRRGARACSISIASAAASASSPRWPAPIRSSRIDRSEPALELGRALGRAQRRRRALPLRARRRVRGAGAAARPGRALRCRDRRSAGLRRIEEGSRARRCAAIASWRGLSASLVAKGGIALHRLLLASSRAEAFAEAVRRGLARCRARRPRSSPSDRRRARPSGASLAARKRLSQSAASGTRLKCGPAPGNYVDRR